ncbi:26S proteasome regulatory subunit, S6a family AAA ATpase [Toxoplasma gondii ME49]|uniref:26S protease regulatory subunit 6a, putative n=8 Tax=Toxoplasma gondii TaxID=5811 RepID=A0A125YWY4_TOXGV|nr:26S proteasome regulatory subunit, S6a family AAA ATpase [Toxoplasma gondii ME49]EPR56965.1 26S proteasome regulatory subunit, S6a family AAA ATpase [Toxoplasma gondii GT1]ESS28437.1 26S proteasome regulatory subunit, S6a family AAA ATpase [Toxoplasma gondii VEG]KAF4638098.1 26S proteasome regulatory subunit, S6a family AAA ATpase [Toxoplasma gondii]EPT25447.1 26S proteasome regulatory subunit, S6a family AAA ATpase [Toxoplasma gondii ME49]CEL77997.1 TPA: 26S protease regulatory subunit 6a,|eukprot:XP_018635190.1 26S proteasome regulatory subunit, S6a family AAA ATpase [Toxoplasma gondii ME49]
MDSAAVWSDESEDVATAELAGLSASDLRMRTSMIDSEVRILKSEVNRLRFELHSMQERIKDNREKIRLNRQLPYLVANVVELFDSEDAEEEEEDGAVGDIDAQRKGKCVVIKTSTRQTIFLPVIGLVDHTLLKPGDLVGVNKDSYLVLDKLPAEYDSRVRAMEVDERPQEEYNDVGGLDKQIQELIEAVVLPMTHKERFEKIGIRPPKGVLMYGPPGTGKTLLARACAAQTKATFLKLAGPQLVQMFIGDGAKMVRDAFELAKEKAPAIIFIDELDAIGTKRFDSELSGDREVQRTMLELLNQLDGFSSDDRIKVIAATNRPDVLDPALLRSGRLDRKIELPHPNEEARERILQIHARKMNVNKEDVNFRELARATDDFNGAQLKAVCVEAGMVALRRGASELCHEDFVEGVAQVQAKKKSSLNYFT